MNMWDSFVLVKLSLHAAKYTDLFSARVKQRVCVCVCVCVCLCVCVCVCVCVLFNTGTKHVCVVPVLNSMCVLFTFTLYGENNF